MRWGTLRHTAPLSREFGYDRGTPVDRFYIEGFLERYGRDVRGRVLEVKDSGYTRRFGGPRVTHREVLDIDANNPNASIVADLASGIGIPSDTFDCIILTQVMQFIYDLPAAVATLHRILRPEGVLLLTVPGISQVAYRQLGPSWHWSFTEASVTRLLSEHFQNPAPRVELHGNVLAATALLQGIAYEELSSRELEAHDPDYQVIIAARAAKSRAPSAGVSGNTTDLR